MLIPFFCLAVVALLSLSVKAEDPTLRANCDNYGTLEVSTQKDVWVVKEQESQWNQWWKQKQVNLKTLFPGGVIPPHAAIRVRCRDDNGLGGFIGEVTFQGKVFGTKPNRLDASPDTPWSAYIPSQDTSKNPITFDYRWLQWTQPGAGWFDSNTGIYAGANLDADWVWMQKAKTGRLAAVQKNIMYFEFSFDAAKKAIVAEPPSDLPSTWFAGSVSQATSTTTSFSMYYLMMLVCGLLLVNIALMTYARCRSCSIGGQKYSKVDLYSSDNECRGINVN